MSDACRKPADIRSFFGGGPKPAAKAKRPLDSGSTADSQAKVASEDASGSEKAAPILASESAAKKKTKARKVIADSDSDGGEFDLETSEPSASKTEASKPRKATKSTPKAVATSPDKPEPKANEAAKKPTAGTLFSPKLKAKAGSSASSSAPTTLVAPSSSSSVSLPAAEGAEAEKAAACAAALAVVSKKETSPESAGKPVPYALLCDAFHEIEQITGRLQITATMTTLFAEVIAQNPADLEPALFLASNRVAPPHANVILGIGEALITKCIVQTFGRTAKAVKEAYDEEGDLGIVAESSRSSQKQLSFAAKPKPLLLAHILKALRTIAETEGEKSGDRKIAVIQKLLRDCKGNEARYIVRALQGKLRIGLAETTVLIALAHAVVASPPPVEDAKNAAADSSASKHLSAEVPLEAESVLEAWHKTQMASLEKDSKKGVDKLPTPSAEVLEASVSLVKQAYAECSDHGLLSQALLAAPLYRVRAYCHLTPATPVAPMLAKPTKSVNEVLKRLSGQRLTVEFKYDGERMQLHRLKDGTIKIFSRSQEDTTQRWPELANSSFWTSNIFTTALAQKEGGDGTFVLDAEVVAWDTINKKLLPFQVLSTRKRKAEESEEQAVQVIVQGFDLIYLHGESLLRKPLVLRRAMMHAAFKEVEGRFTFAQGQDVDLRDPTDKLRDQATREAEKAALLACAGPEATGRAAAALVGKDSESGISVAAGDAGAATAGADSGGGEAVEKCETTSSDSKGGDKKDSQEDDEEFGSSAEEGEQMMAAFMSDAVEGSCEGLMVKTLYGDCSTYEPSVRSLNWLKLKKDYMDAFGGADSIDLVPIGGYLGKGKRTGVWGAYLLACYDPDSDEFQSVCKIGTGFSDEALRDLSTQFEAHALPSGAPRPKQYKLGDSLEPDVYFKAVKTWEIRCADLSLSSAHKGANGKRGIDAGRGIGLRFPRFLRQRDDKPPTHATSADQIRDMYFDQQSVDSSAMAAAAAAEPEEEDWL